jgi:hypothetical protein
MNQAIKDIYKRAGISMESDEKDVSESIEPEITSQICGICKEEKPISAFGLTDTGKHKHLCTNCELDKIATKEQPKIVGQGKPMLKFPDGKKKKSKPARPDEVKHDKTVEKRIAKNIAKTPKEVKKVVEKIGENRKDDTLDPELVKELKKNKRVKRRVSKTDKRRKKKKVIQTEIPAKELRKQMLDSEAYELFEAIILTYLERYEDGFTNSDIWVYLQKKRGVQWIYAKLKRMVKVGLLKVDKRTRPNIYYVNEIIPKPTLKEKVETERKELFNQEYIEDKVREKMGIKEDEPKKKLTMLKGTGKVVVKAQKEAQKGIEEKFKEANLADGPVTFMIPEEDFIKKVEKVADKMVIDFNEKSTTIIVSPTHNILRAYDMLSDKQKENAEILTSDGKVLKFRW